MESPWGCWVCRWHKGQAEMQRLGELKPEQLPARGIGIRTDRGPQGEWGKSNKDVINIME